MTKGTRDLGLWFAIAATVAALVIYAPTLGNGIVGYDDSWLVAENYVVQDMSWDSVSTILFDLHSTKRFTLAPEYLPIRDLSVMLDFAIWGDAYGGHHATNLALYLAGIWLWFGAFIGFGIDRKVAGIAVLVWAVHPSHAESVAWLAERKGLLAVAFSGATALCYARFRAGRSARWLVAAALLAILAVWSKAHAAFAIGALAGLELVLPQHRVSTRRSIAGLATIAVVAGLAFVPVLAMALSASVVGADAAPAGRLAMVLGVHGFYVRLAALAQVSSVSYPLSFDAPGALDTVLGVLGLVAIAVALGLRGRTPPPVRAGCVIWLFGWLPVSHLVLPLQMVMVADRYLLVPSLGFALVVAAGIDRITKPRLGYALLAVIAVASIARSLDARTNWADRESLWERAVTTAPLDGAAWSAYAEAVAAHDPERAFAIVEEGLRHTSHPRLLLRRALLLASQGDRAGSREAMRVAAEAGEPRAMANLALMLVEEKRLDEALVFARRSVAASALYEPGQRALGTAALAARRYDEAEAAFQRANEIVPSCVNAYNLALAELELGRFERARPRLAHCEHDPKVGPRVQAALAELARRGH